MAMLGTGTFADSYRNATEEREFGTAADEASEDTCGDCGAPLLACQPLIGSHALVMPVAHRCSA